MGFSEQLKKARVSMGYTQQQVADALGLTASTYCGYETGKRQPDVAKLKQLARILNTTGSSFWRRSPEPAAGRRQAQRAVKKTVDDLGSCRRISERAENKKMNL